MRCFDVVRSVIKNNKMGYDIDLQKYYRLRFDCIICDIFMHNTDFISFDLDQISFKAYINKQNEIELLITCPEFELGSTSQPEIYNILKILILHSKKVTLIPDNEPEYFIMKFTLPGVWKEEGKNE